MAQTAGEMGAASDTGALSSQRQAIKAVEDKVGDLAKRIEAQPEDDAHLVDIRVQLEKLAREVFDVGLAFRPRIADINSRLENLGPARGEGEPPEPDIVTAERTRLTDAKASINTLIGEAERLSLRINRMAEDIAKMRRELFARTLSRRYDVSAAVSSDVIGEFRTETARVYQTVASWMRFVTQYKTRALLAAIFLPVLAALCLFFGGRRFFGDFISPDPAEEAPTYLSRLSVALSSTLVPSASFAVLLGAFYFFLSYFNILRGDIGEILWSLVTVVATVFFVYCLARAVLTPSMANWRLLPVRSPAARWLLWLAGATAVVTGFDFFMNAVYEIFGSQLSLTVATSLIATVIVGLLIILIGLVKPFAEDDGAPRAWPLKFRYLLFVLGAATIIAAVLGYIGFARFLSQQIVIAGAIVATMYIGFLTAGAVASEGAFAHSALGRRLANHSAFDDKGLDQLGLLASIVINLSVLLIGVPLILLQWGFKWADLTTWTYGIAREIQIGSLSFSIIGILTGILVFIIGYFVTRWFQAWLDGSVMARSRVDSGVRNSIRTAIGYAGVAVAGLIGISAAGIDLSSLALVAGALSLGIGFGLQNIVSNFVSGLILLVERPFKAGDWIVAGTVSGTVRKISVRATEIETFQRQTMILPNSELINAAVGNWTHKNNLGRLEVMVRVAYGSDAKRVHEILLEIARNHDLVLKNPEPFVLFAGFGEFSMDFEIRVYLADILTQLDVQNDLRFTVLEAFKEEGIEIPLPQRDIRFRSGTVSSPDQQPEEQPMPDELQPLPRSPDAE